MHRAPVWEKTGLILLAGFLFGITIASVGVASRDIPPVTLTALRLITAALIFAGIFAFLKPKINFGWGFAIKILILGILNVAWPFLSLAVAVHYISSSLAAVLFNVQPIFTLFSAHLLLKDEKLKWFTIIATLISISGATLILVTNETGLVSTRENGWVGQVIILGACVMGGLGVVCTRLWFQKVDPIVITAGNTFSTLLVLAPLALITEGLPALSTYSFQSWVTMAVSAIAAPVLGFWIMFYLTNKYSASLAGFVGIATPLFSVLIGVFVLSEVITLPIVVGTVLLLGGVWALQYF